MTAPVEVKRTIDASLAPKRLFEIRDLIFAAAEATGTAPLTETLKWGQPAYLPAKRAGTTIRLGATAAHAALYVHCQTRLVDQYRDRFPNEFEYEGNRAVLIPHDQPLATDALAQVIAMALTYHRAKVQA
ncbi:MAG: DUF1801 domain-containing protein [Pseudomonadota bacterium]